jgi:hypothetical protein
MRCFARERNTGIQDRRDTDRCDGSRGREAIGQIRKKHIDLLPARGKEFLVSSRQALCSWPDQSPTSGGAHCTVATVADCTAATRGGQGSIRLFFASSCAHQGLPLCAPNGTAIVNGMATGTPPPGRCGMNSAADAEIESIRAL